MLHWMQRRFQIWTMAAMLALLAACGGAAEAPLQTPQATADATVPADNTDRRKTAANTTAAGAAIDGLYKLENQCSGKIIQVADASTADAARVRLATWTGGAHQQWKIEVQSDGAYRLVAQHSGKVLDASLSQAREDGVLVFHQYGWHGKANQRFAIEPLGDGNHKLIVQHNQKALDVRGAGTADGTTVWQWDDNATCAQRFKLVRLDVVDDTTPVATQVSAGQDQSAQVGAAVPVRPAIRVLDRQGRGVPNMSVTFVVVAGNGSVSGANQTTDANGIATVGAWTLGPSPGPNTLSARTAGLPEVTVSATGVAAAADGTLQLADNTNNQSASVGQAVLNTPAVIVRNAQGQLQQGVTVSFAITTGGGSVQNAQAVSDANGVASSGGWTLGPNAGTQTLRASAPGYAEASFSATALATGAPSLARSVFMGGLQNPWDLAFTPDGAMLYTERSRGLSVRLADGTTRSLFRPTDLVAQGQSGMLGMTLDPQFASNRRVYVYMASNAGGATSNRVVRIEVNADYSGVGNRSDLISGISYAGGAHSGGRVRVGPDGYVYITTGDNRVGSVPQNLNALGGKVLRITRDGAAAPGNNPPAGANALIYAYGFRNPQGLAFRPGSGAPYLSEHGPNFQDEVTPLRAGGNGGWDPLCSNGSGGYCGYDNVTQMTDVVKFPNAMRAAWTTGSTVGSSRGMGGSVFVSGAQWRDWNGALIVALMSGRRLEVLRLTSDGATTTANTPLFESLGERLRFVATGPDGALYVATDGKSGGDEIWRVVAN
jgi:glucose/arabinose dehydrogenase/predicted small lipoprotein YifL